MKEFQLTQDQEGLVTALTDYLQPPLEAVHQGLVGYGLTDLQAGAVLRDEALTIALQYEHGAAMVRRKRLTKEEWIDICSGAFDQYEEVADMAYSLSKGVNDNGR